MYSGDPNTEHSLNGYIRLPNFWKFVIQAINHATYDLNGELLVRNSSHDLNNELLAIQVMAWITNYYRASE